MICKTTGFLMLNYVPVLFWSGACLGSRDTNAKVRCSTLAQCVWQGDILFCECFLEHPVVTSVSEVTSALPPQPAQTVHLSSWQADGSRDVGATTSIHGNTEGSSRCISSCADPLSCWVHATPSEVWDPQGPFRTVFSCYWDTEYPTGMATLFLSLSMKSHKVKLGMWLQRAAFWAGMSECTSWLNGCRDVCGACLHLIIVLSFPFSVVRWQNYLLHKCMVIQ